MANLKDIEVTIPNLGEAEETEVIEISVSIGDKVNINDPLIVLESEKAAMEVPSDLSGTVKEIKIKEGDNVKEGQPFITIEADESIKIDAEPLEKSSAIPQTNSQNIIQNQIQDIPLNNQEGINAGPAVRKVARELEIDLLKIKGTGKNKLITKEDLKNYVHSLKGENEGSFADLEKLKDFGNYEIENQSKIRALGAKNLQKSWTSIPHVTHFEEIDITNVELDRLELNKTSKFKITPLAYIVQAVVKALKEYPIFNSSLVGEGELMLRNYINIGIAVDTNDGLVVPNIKNAESISLNEIAYEILELAKKAKSKKLLSKNLSGGTFSISSLGAMGGTGFTPIINPPEVGIIGVSRSKKHATLMEGQLVEKTMLPLALSYDHRVINGADAGKFMYFIKEFLEKSI